MANGINFAQMITKMQQAQLTASDRPAIWGGTCAAAQLDALLDELSQAQPDLAGQMNFRIWEYTDRIEFANARQPQRWLLRVEWFGEGGHLSLRRNGSEWLWHLIGPRQWDSKPHWLQLYAGEDFWGSHSDTQLRRYPEHLLLWGEKDQSMVDNGAAQWFDSRVASACLEYPSSLSGCQRIYLHYWRYCEGGHTAFVWHRALNGAAQLGESNHG